MASEFIRQDAWVQARDRFLENLDGSERAIFANASLENIFYSASVAQKAHETKSRSRRIAARLNIFLAGIEEWGKALDVYANASGMILSPLWGSLRVIIHLSSQCEKYFVKVIDMLVEIGDVIPRFQDYARLFPLHLRLIQALSAAYLDIIGLCTLIKEKFLRAKTKLGNIQLLLNASWKSVDRRFQTLLVSFQQHRQSVEKEAELSHLLEEGKARDSANCFASQIQKHNTEGERIKMLSFLSAIKWGKQHSKVLRRRHQNTATWILDTNIFRMWKEDPASCILYISGMPGSGKTVLTASVIDTLSKDATCDRAAITHCYCDHADSNTLEASSVIGTIIQQLLIDNVMTNEIAAATLRSMYGQGLRHPSCSELLELLCHVLHERSPVFIILDGFDETDSENQEEILHMIRTILALQGVVIKIYFSSRESVRFLDAFEGRLRLRMTEAATAHDLNACIEYFISNALAKHAVVLKQPQLLEIARQELLAKAQGMFLWVFLQQWEMMDQSHSEQSFKSTLHNLPKGLTATYERIFHKISQRPARQLEVANKIFDWTLAARRPLTLPELREAIAVDPGDVSLDRSKIPAETDGRRFLQGCGNLVLYDEKDNTVQLVHHTVSSFLREVRGRRVPSDDFVGDICMTYLQFSDFETQIVKHSQRSAAQNSNLVQTMSTHIPRLLGIGGGIYQFLLSIYHRSKPRPLAETDYHELLKRYERPPLGSNFEHFDLLDYVRQNWVWHTKHFENGDRERWQQFQTLIFSKTLMFDFRPWIAEQSSQTLPHLPLFLWAIRANHMSLLLSLKDFSKGSLKLYVEYLDLPEANLTLLPQDLLANCDDAVLMLLIQESPILISNERWMQWALRYNRLEVLKLMLDQAEGLGLQTSRNFVTRRFVNSYSQQSGLHKSTSNDVLALMAIHVAAFKGSIELMRVLLIHGADIEARDSHFRTPLFYACGFIGEAPHLVRVEAVQYCLQHRASVNAFDKHGDTVMHRMIKLGIRSQPLIRLLMDQRADLKHRNGVGQSVTLLAVKFAPTAMLKLMAESGLDLEEKDDKGETFLMKAVAGHEISQDRVKILLESGASVHTSNKMGTSILHKAMQSDPSKHLMEMLLEAGARVNTSSWGGSILQTAVKSTVPLSLIKLLVEAGADVNFVDLDGRPILHEAIMSNWSTDIIDLFLGAGASTKATDLRGCKALDQAIAWKSTEVVKVLIDHGVDVNSLDYSNGLALSQALREGPEDMAEIIIKSGADTDKVMGHGEPPIVYVTRGKQWEMARILLENGATIQPPTAYGNREDNPIYWSTHGRNSVLLRLLLEKVESEMRWQDLNLLRAFINVELDEVLDDAIKRVLADYKIYETPRGPRMSWVKLN